MKRVLGVFLILLIVGFIGIGSYALFNVQQLNQKPVTSAETLGVTSQVVLEIEFGDGEVIAQGFGDVEGKTAFDLLQETVEDNELKLETKQYDFGVFVESINGFVSTADKSWIYFVNGAAGNVAADKYSVKPGDQISWKYIEPVQ